MRTSISLVCGTLLSLCFVNLSFSQPLSIDTFQSAPEQRWRFFADSVMGGVSSGKVEFQSEEGGYARLTGQVSTANNGGLIQIRRKIKRPPSNVEGIKITVRGNGQRYIVHLRTSGTVLPWQYYQASYDTSSKWNEIRIPFDAFKPSSRLLRKLPLAQSLKSVAVVAFGRNHEARVEVREVGFY